MSKQTAVEWLVDELLSGKPLMPYLIDQAKQMEKKQIRKAFEEGDDWSQNYFDNLMPVGEVYYQKNYGGDDE